MEATAAVAATEVAMVPEEAAPAEAAASPIASSKKSVISVQICRGPPLAPEVEAALL